MSIIIGFTGTRKGTTRKQAIALADLLRRLVPTCVHQGCCVGADEDFCGAASACDPAVRIVGHPCTLRGMTSQQALGCSNEVRPLLPPLERNRNIVAEAADGLIACPAGMEEELRSGTWATVRAARRAGRHIWIVWPDGSVTGE